MFFLLLMLWHGFSGGFFKREGRAKDHEVRGITFVKNNHFVHIMKQFHAMI